MGSLPRSKSNTFKSTNAMLFQTVDLLTQVMHGWLLQEFNWSVDPQENQVPLTNKQQPCSLYVVASSQPHVNVRRAENSKCNHC